MPLMFVNIAWVVSFTVLLLCFFHTKHVETLLYKWIVYDTLQRIDEDFEREKYMKMFIKNIKNKHLPEGTNNYFENRFLE